MKQLSSYLFWSVLAASTLSSCEKSDPFVDRVVSPVLVQIRGGNGSYTSGTSTDPTVSIPFGESSKLGIRILELDKTYLLDYTKGIDSIPVASTVLILKTRKGSEIGSFTTEADGLAKIEVPLQSLGISKIGETASLTASGKHKNVAFTKLFKVVAK